MSPWVPGLSRRSWADLLLFGVTVVELVLLVLLTPTFTIVDWIYVVQNVLVLGISLARRPPASLDRSLTSAAAVVVAYTYPYAQVVWLRWQPGVPGWPEAGLVVVTVAAVWGLASLLSIGRRFGVRPAARGLATTGTYRLVRHPIYLGHVLGDIGYNLQEWNLGTVLLVLAGWLALLYRIHVEERLLAGDPGWAGYVARVRSRVVPGVW